MIAQHAELGELPQVGDGLASMAENRYMSALYGAMKVEWSSSCRESLSRSRPRKCTYRPLAMSIVSSRYREARSKSWGPEVPIYRWRVSL